MSGLRWLSRDTVRAPRLLLVLSQSEFLRAAKECGIDDPGQWLDEDRNPAVLHSWESRGRLSCLLCLNAPDNYDPIDVATTIVHESVHVFQRLCDSIGEQEPSREFEAYSIERISETFMREYVRRKGA